jgi:hypothetical protein
MESLKLVSWFMFCSDANLREIARRMTKEVYLPGDDIIKQGDTHRRLIVVAEGSVERLRYFVCHVLSIRMFYSVCYTGT